MTASQPAYPVVYNRARAEYTYEEIAAELGVSKSLVQLIEHDALTKCLLWCQDHGYRLEDLIDRRRSAR